MPKKGLARGNRDATYDETEGVLTSQQVFLQS